MLHGPCGENYPNAPCMTDVHGCSKNYPKPFQATTTFEIGRRPIYRRIEGPPFINANGVQYDNRHDVPYNAQLLYKYNCHINVEVAGML